MSKRTDNYFEELELLINQLKDSGKYFRDTANGDVDISGFAELVDGFAQSLYNGESVGDAGREGIDKIYQDYEFLMRFVDTTIADYSGKKLSGVEAEQLKHVQKISDIIHDDHVTSLVNAYRIRDSYVHEYGTGTIEEKITAQFQTIGLHGVKPTVDECLNLHMSNPDVDKTMQNFMWLAVNAYKTERLYETGEENIYTSTLERFRDEMNVAAPEESAVFVTRITSLELALKDACMARYNDFLKNAPKDVNPEDYAKLSLSESEEYTALQATNHFCGSLFATRVANIRIDLGHALLSESERNLAKRESSLIGGLLAGEMGKFLDKQQVDSKVASASEIEHFIKDVDNSGYLDQSKETLIGLYKDLLADKETASGSFTAMRDSLKDFINLDHANAANIPDYTAKLDAAIKGASDYFASHSGRRWTTNGEKRRDLSEKLALELKAAKVQYEKKINKEFEHSTFTTTGSTEGLSAELVKMVPDAVKNGVSKQEFVDKLMGIKVPEGKDYQQKYDAKKKEKRENNKNKENKELELPDMDLSVSEEEAKYRQETMNIAKKQFLEAKYELLAMPKAVRLGMKMKEIPADVGEGFINERDQYQVFFNFGEDGKTLRENIDIAKLLTQVGVDKSNPKSVEKNQKQVAALFEKRINELSKRDYEKYLDMDDRTFAENFHQYSQDCFSCSVIENVVRKMADNPFVKQETREQAIAIVNKYSTYVPYLDERINTIVNPYYVHTNTDALLNMSYEEVDSLPGDEGYGEMNRFITKLKGQAQFRAMAVGNYMMTSAMDNPGSKEETKEMALYDLQGNRMSDLDVNDKIKEGPIIAINKNHPERVKVFDSVSNGRVPVAMDEKKLEAIMPQLSAFQEKLTVEKRYNDFYEQNKNKVFEDGRYDSSALSTLSGLHMLNMAETFKTLPGCEKEGARVLKDAFYAIKLGGTLDDFTKKMPEGPWKEHAEKLYQAGKLDLKYMDLAKSTAKKVMDSVKTFDYDTKSFDAARQKLGISTLSQSESNKLRIQRTTLQSKLNERAVEREFGYVTQNRWTAIPKYDPRKTKEDQIELYKTAQTKEGVRQIYQSIADEMLMLDYDEIEKVNFDGYVKNFDKFEYIRNMAFDYKFIDFPESEGIFSPLEREAFQKYTEATFGYLSCQEKKASLCIGKLGGYIDTGTVSVETAAKGMQLDPHNANFWAETITGNASKVSEQEALAGRQAHESIIESRWVNTLLGKPDISKEETEFINDCLKSEDRQHGRMRLYEYAMGEVLNAAGKSGDVGSPEKASYARAMGVAGKLIEKSMKIDGYDVDKERLQELSTASEQLRKVKGDVTLTLEKGRSLNEPAKKAEQEFAEKRRAAEEAKKLKEAMENRPKSNVEKFAEGAVKKSQQDLAALAGKQTLTEQDISRARECMANVVVYDMLLTERKLMKNGSMEQKFNASPKIEEALRNAVSENPVFRQETANVTPKSLQQFVQGGAHRMTLGMAKGKETKKEVPKVNEPQKNAQKQQDGRSVS